MRWHPEAAAAVADGRSGGRVGSLPGVGSLEGRSAIPRRQV